MNRKRLLKLADLLEADAGNRRGIKFDFYSWGWVDDVRRPISCGTTACAMGLAAICGAFKRAGLDWGHGKAGQIVFKINGRRRDPIRAAMHTFDISELDAIFLFASGGCLGKSSGAQAERAVAKRIREFIAYQSSVGRKDA